MSSPWGSKGRLLKWWAGQHPRDWALPEFLMKWIHFDLEQLLYTRPCEATILLQIMAGYLANVQLKCSHVRPHSTHSQTWWLNKSNMLPKTIILKLKNNFFKSYSSVILQLFLKTNSQHNLSSTTFLVWVWDGRVLVGTFIQGWVLINLFCLWDGHLFEVGANSRLGAYSNKYGMWKYPPPLSTFSHSVGNGLISY